MDLTKRCNDDAFTPEKVMPWLNFQNSPPLGVPAPDFPLWQLDDQGSEGTQTSLSEMWSNQAFTVVEFGSYT